MSSTSNYASTPRIGSALIAVANSGTRAIPVGASTLITAAASGTLINRATIIGGGAEAADPADKKIQFYVHDGSTYYLIREVDFDPTTPTTALAQDAVEVVFNDLVLPTGWSFRAAISIRGSAVDDTFVTAFGADF